MTGNGSVSGSGVMIYNAGSNYPSSGGTFGSVNLNGNGNISLTPATRSAPAGILIFQSRDNPSTVALSGNGIVMPGGTVYAPDAALTMSGNGQFKGSLVVNTLSISGNSIAQLSAGSQGTTVYSPDQVRTSYGVNNLSLDGTGQTIAIVDAYDNPSIYQSLDAFDAQFKATSSGSTLDQLYGPAAAFLTVVNQRGDASSLPATDPVGLGNDNWEVETALDVEWVHAAAPGARIILVEADSQSLSDLMTAVTTAAQQPSVSVVSMSWGFAEGQEVLAQDEATYDSYFTTPVGHQGVTFVASSGDYGAAVSEYPAMSPNVVAVGGTSLSLNADNSYNSETGWGYTDGASGTVIGSGGGLSQYESEPVYQQGVQSTGRRTAPDVALVADPSTGVWIADTYNLASNPFETVGGTSLSAPAWAGLIALANQSRADAGLAPLNTANTNETQQALYSLPQTDYNVITSGSNGYSAGAGYNLVTGLGTPVANLLVPDLAAWQGPGSYGQVQTVGAIQDANLQYTGDSSSSAGDGAAFQIFDFMVSGASRRTGLHSTDATMSQEPSVLTVTTASPDASPGAGHSAATGDASAISSQRLYLASPFSLMASSSGTMTDGGFVVQTDSSARLASGQGNALPSAENHLSASSLISHDPLSAIGLVSPLGRAGDDLLSSDDTTDTSEDTTSPDGWMTGTTTDVNRTALDALMAQGWVVRHGLSFDPRNGDALDGTDGVPLQGNIDGAAWDVNAVQNKDSMFPEGRETSDDL